MNTARIDVPASVLKLFAVLLLSLSTTACEESRTDAEERDARFLGLRTVVYNVDDIVEATDWYSKALDIEPYFNEPFYVGFNVGGFELGLSPDEGEIVMRSSGNAYWGVADIETVWQYLIDAGATPDSGIEDVGGDILAASLRDPWGNIIGLIQNPHFDKTRVR